VSGRTPAAPDARPAARFLLSGLAILPAILAGPPDSQAADRPAQRYLRAAVVSVDARASEAGMSLLNQGGNAADAAVATALALTVVHPQAGNLAGGHFSLWRGAQGDVEVIDGRETAPAAAHERLFLDGDGRAVPGASLTSPLAIGVPGTLPALGLLHARHGRLPWSAAVEPALRLAADGFPVSRRLAFDLRRFRDRLVRDPDAAAVFFPNGDPPVAGEILVQADLAHSLREIRDLGPTGSGPLARRLAADLERRGALLTAADLAGYRPLVRRPLETVYRGYRVLAPPLPSAGGLSVIQALQTLRLFDIQSADRGGSRLVHLLAESLRHAFADRYQWTGDPAFVDVPMVELLDPRRMASWSRAISMTQVSPSRPLFGASHEKPGAPEGNVGRKETTHFSVVDRWGNAVSQTTTLNSLFGTGCVARGTGILWNNEMDDFASGPSLANLDGVPGSAGNAIAPGKRPLSSMSPVIIERDGRLAYLLGSPGGTTIPSTVVQVIIGLVDLELEPQAAVNEPRIHHQGLPARLEYEPGALSPDVRRALARLGYPLHPRERLQGDVHLIAVGPAGDLLVAADPRRGGSARGE
jgi:gamma-glutamyltranspeptidase/glutathione hydrolase